MLDVKPARDRYVGRITGPETAIIIVSIVIISLNVNTAFSNMYNLCMKELLIVVNIVTIRLNKKETFSDMYNLCMKELLIVVRIVTIKQTSPTCAISA